MFHRNQNRYDHQDLTVREREEAEHRAREEHHRRFGFFGRKRQDNFPRHAEYDRTYNDGNVVRNTHVETTYGYGAPSTKSDWDHYAVRHEDALIGDPIPFADNTFQGGYRTGNTYNSNNATGPRITHGTSGNHPGPVVYPTANNSFGMTHHEYVYEKPGKHVKYVSDGPVAFNAPFDNMGKPMRGNYATGSVIEDGYSRGGQPLTGNTYNGGAPIYGGNHPHSAYGPSYGNQFQERDVRDNRTPLLPENPWTHNELGREYVDVRSTGVYKPVYDAPMHSRDMRPKKEHHGFFHHKQQPHPNSNVHPNAYPNSSYPNTYSNSNTHPGYDTRY